MTTPNTFPSEKDLLHPHNRWKYTSDCMFQVYKPGRGVFFMEYELSHADLAQYHPDFPDAMEALILWNYDETGTGFVEGESPSMNLHHLRDGHFTVSDKIGRDRHLTNVTSLRLGHSDNSVWINSGVLEMRRYAGRSKVQPFVTGSSNTTVVSVDNINALFPGWQRRYQVGCDIGLEKEELCRHVFATSSTNDKSVVIPPIEFE